MKKIIFTFLIGIHFFSFSIGIIPAQTDDVGAPYFPLCIGNTYYYVERGYSFEWVIDSSFVISRITNSRIIGGKTYYHCTNFCGNQNDYYLRYDSTTGKSCLLRFFEFTL